MITDNTEMEDSGQGAYISTLKAALKELVDSAPYDIPEPVMELYGEVDSMLTTDDGGATIYHTALLLGALGFRLTIVPKT